MGISKVDFNGETLVDLTQDTVNGNSLLEGYSAHNAAGELIEGQAVIPTKVSQLENDAGYKTTDNDTWKANTASSEGYVAAGSGHVNQVWKTDANGVPGWRADANTTYGVATTSTNGLMSSGDKTKLNGIASGANKTSITNNLTATKAGTALDAAQGKILNDKGAQINVYKGSDGNLHFRNWSGADTVIPFSGGGFQYQVIAENKSFTYNASWTADKDYPSLFIMATVNQDPTRIKVTLNGTALNSILERIPYPNLGAYLYIAENVKSGQIINFSVYSYGAYSIMI